MDLGADQQDSIPQVPEPLESEHFFRLALFSPCLKGDLRTKIKIRDMYVEA